jgi:hypothetical protein
MIAQGDIGIDPALVRLMLAALAEEYGQRIALVQSGSERRALVEAWARQSERELDVLDTNEATHLRALYRAVLEGVAP